MESIKKNWKNILIVLLVLFSLSKCTQSCNRATTVDEVKKEAVSKDSIIKTLNDSCTTLNTTIEVYKERVNGMQQSIDIQNEAAKRIAESKKNIKINIKK